MSLSRQGIDPIPEETVKVEQAAFPKGNVYMQMRDELGTMFEDEDFAELYARRGQPGLAPWRLALISVMQFAENLTDRQAADAVRGRIDWKYALGLDLTDAGFAYSVLSEFRGRLVGGQSEAILLDKMLEAYTERGLLKRRSKQRTDSTHILAGLRNLNRLELAHETLRHTLNVLAEVVPDWLKAQVEPDWYERYGERLTEFRIPEARQEQQEMAVTIGAHGLHLLQALYTTEELRWLRAAPAVETLRQVWVQAFYQMEGQGSWREKGNQPSLSRTVASPHDTQARYSTKRGISWVGIRCI